MSTYFPPILQLVILSITSISEDDMKFVEDFSEARLENSLDRKLDMATVIKQIFTEEITENNTTG